MIATATPAVPNNKRWYVVHAYSGMEKAVERNLRERIDRSEMQEKFGRILVPMEEVVARAAEAVESIIAEGAAQAMTKHNRRAQGLKTEEE